VVVNENAHTFYAVVYKVNNSVRPLSGCNERLIKISQIKEDISHTKNTNYLLNSLVTKKAKEKGGYLGIMVDELGHVLESPMSNIAFVFHNNEFNVPPFDKTLKGTTVVRLMEYIEEQLIPNGVVTGINREWVHVESIGKCVKEAMFVGGDFVVPILKIDDICISDEPGEITKKLQAFLLNDKKSEEVSEEIII